MKHLVLLGDSILDNRPYVPRGKDVASHLQKLRPDLGVSLLAEDGATTQTLKFQLDELKRVPDVTDLVLSIGGNDALQMARHLLERRVQSVGEAVRLLHGEVASYHANYLHLVEQLRAFQKPLVLCTIYDCDFEPARAPLETVLALYNNVIIRTATEQGLPLLDLRPLLDDPADYEQRIEPSVTGGKKIAAAIAAQVAA